MLFTSIRIHIVPNSAYLRRFGGDLSWFAYKASRRKPPPKRRKYAGFGTKGIRESIVLHRHSLATLKEPCLDKLLAFYQHTNKHHPKFWRWFAMVCLFYTVFTAYRPTFWWWFAVVCLIVIPEFMTHSFMFLSLLHRKTAACHVTNPSMCYNYCCIVLNCTLLYVIDKCIIIKVSSFSSKF